MACDQTSPGYLLVLTFLAWAALPPTAGAQANPPEPPTLSAGYAFVERNGAALYANICQGCHMSDGKGATGAGTYPSLARDANLAGHAYPLRTVVYGARAMPPFGNALDDAQIAAVVNYVRTHFGNQYADAVTKEDVEAARR
jgi:mono/diheme cytochrome c family protein